MSQNAENQSDVPAIPASNLIFSLLAIGALAMALNVIGGVLVGIGALMAFGQEPTMDFVTKIRTGSMPINDPTFEALNFGLMILIYVALAIAIWLVAKFRPKMSFARRVAWLDWDGDRNFWWLALAAGPLYGLISGWLLGLLEPQIKDLLQLPQHLPASAMAFGVIVILGPMVEELLFRGWIYTALRSRISFVATAFITALLFALAHYENTFTYAIAVFPMGLLLAYVRERYGSIKATIVVHGIFNLFALIMNYIGVG